MKGSLDKYPRAQEIMQAIGLETNPEARMYQVSIFRHIKYKFILN